MTSAPVLRIEGGLDSPREFNLDDLRQLAAIWQVEDVTRLGARCGGDAVRLAGLLAAVGSRQTVTHLGLHGSRDDFHASVPLEPVKDSAIIIYQRDGRPLDVDAGGPFRFFIPNHTACHTSDIDECANVKFLDRIELAIGKGHDNRPEDDEEHARLHEQQE